MIERRPIVFYERLMHTYDAQVAHLMAAKTSYILFSEDCTADAIDLSQPVAVVPKAKPIVVEVLLPHKIKAVTEKRQPSAKTEVPTVKKSTTGRRKPVAKAVNPTKIRPGLGLSLDDILSEEASVAAKGNSRYFKNN